MPQGKMSEGYNTKLRRQTIRKLISTERLSTQKELSERLAAEGFQATQATISRDIRELHLVKISDSNGKYYTFPETSDELIATDQFRSLYRSLAQRVDRAQNLIVIHTNAGMASALCATMDRMDWKGVLGTLAGDDTVLLITVDETAAMNIMEGLAGI